MIRLYIFTLLLPIALFCESSLTSNIPLPKTDVQNLDPALLENANVEHSSVLETKPAASDAKLRIALLIPYSKIGKYATSTTNASFAYLMSKNRPFELKSYKIEDESYDEIFKTLKKIQADGFSYIIAPLTQSGEKIVSKINPQINIYFPTINKKDAQTTSKYLYYGGIDYRAQSDLLLKESVSPLVIFYDKSEIGEQLSNYQEYKFKQDNATTRNNVVKFSIPQQITSLEDKLKDNPRISGGSFFVNTPIVKSGMIMSQLTLYNTNATNVLSTQTNYNPLLLSMTQYQDRKNMIIANSITQNNDELIETNSLLGNDIVYEWINYTTTVGIDYFSYIISGAKREYNIENVNNQMIYPIVLLEPSVSRFIPYKSTAD